MKRYSMSFRAAETARNPEVLISGFLALSGARNDIQNMPTLMQKIRLAFRGWQRRREERDREFIAKNTWSGAPARSPEPPRTAALDVDIEGLTIAYLDGSGRT